MPRLDAFVDDLDGYLTELKTTFMPYGSHTLSEVPAGEQLVAMIDGMLGNHLPTMSPQPETAMRPAWHSSPK